MPSITAMRVVHLAAVDRSGGAARSAFRLHAGLLARGMDSTLLVGKKISSAATVIECRPPAAEAGDPEAFCWDLIERHSAGANRTPLSNTYFSVAPTGGDLSEHPLVRAADVINLHWVAGFQSVTAVARLAALGKPLVWTLHDQRPFTGGCHFTAGCQRFTTDCRDCPQLAANPLQLPAALLADQQALWPAGAITVACPSRWLADGARRSAVFRHARVENIPYGVETDVFQPEPMGDARRHLQLQPEARHLLFGADYGEEKRKGFAELTAALKICLQHPPFADAVRGGRIVLLGFGRPSSALAALPAPVRLLGSINNDALMSRIYSAADFFLLPSIEDNLPNTMIEAMSCGTPVVGFATGGIPDLVTDGVTGKLAPTGDVPALAAAILELAADPQRAAAMRPHCRQLIETHHSIAAQAAAYSTLYEALPNRPAGVPPPAGLGPNLRSIYPDLLIASLAQHARRLKANAGQERRLARRLAGVLGELQSAPGTTSTEPQRLADALQQELAAVAWEREQRRARRHAKRAAWRVTIARWFRWLTR